MSIINNLFKGKEKGIGLFPFFPYKPKAGRISNANTFYDRSVYFAKALDKRASVVSGIEFYALKPNGEIDEETQKLLDEPSDLLTGDDLGFLMQLYYDLYGAYYLYKETEKGKVVKLHLLDPTRIEMKFDLEGNLAYFQDKNKKTQSYTPDEIIFEYRPNPNDIKEPVGILNEGARDVLRTEIELREYQKKIAGSGGRINGVFSFDTEKGLSKEQITQLKEAYAKQIEEARDSDAGQMPFFLGGKASFMDLNRSPQEIQYLQSQQAVLEEVSTITGVPKTILSSFDDIKFSNAEEARKTFLAETIKPIVRKRIATLNQYLAPEGIEIVSEDIIPEDMEEKRKTLETANNISALTTNEKREALGYDEMPGHDEILAPMGLMPLSKERNNEEST